MNETVRLVLTIVQVIVSLVLILTVIFQSGKQAGLSGSINGVADTFFGKNKARSLDAKLERLTTITAICFIVLTFILTILEEKNKKTWDFSQVFFTFCFFSAKKPVLY